MAKCGICGTRYGMGVDRIAMFQSCPACGASPTEQQRARNKGSGAGGCCHQCGRELPEMRGGGYGRCVCMPDYD
ncbi:MAG: hypothetical protein ABIG71_01150 [Candidatus Uhrbacteria bacterium]